MVAKELCLTLLYTHTYTPGTDYGKAQCREKRWGHDHLNPRCYIYIVKERKAIWSASCEEDRKIFFGSLSSCSLLKGIWSLSTGILFMVPSRSSSGIHKNELVAAAIAVLLLLLPLRPSVFAAARTEITIVWQPYPKNSTDTLHRICDLCGKAESKFGNLGSSWASPLSPSDG